MVQEFLGRGNVVLREANGGKELANITADLGVTFQPSTSPESNKHGKNSITCVSINKKNYIICQEKEKKTLFLSLCCCCCCWFGKLEVGSE